MATLLRRLLGATPPLSPLPTDPTDDVIPAFPLDGHPTNRGISMSWTLRFNDVLDPEKRLFHRHFGAVDFHILADDARYGAHDG